MVKTKSALRTAALLRLLSKEGPLSLDEIAARLDMAKSSTFELIHTLESCNMLSLVNGTKKRYALSLSLYGIILDGVQKNRLLQVAKPALFSINEKTGATALLAVPLDDTHLIYVDCESHKSSHAPFENLLGNTALYHASAAGKAMLMHKSEREILDQIGHSTYAIFTDKTIKSFGELKDDLLRWKNLGYACEKQEEAKDSYSIASPIFDGDICVGALTIKSVYTKRLVSYENRLGQMVRCCAHDISRLLLNLA